jgi:hypothetical protein
MLLPLLFAAHAQEFLVHPTWMVEPQPGTVYQNGIGSPAVAYDPAADQWTMFFETQFGAEDAVGGPCRQGRWGIGRATSPDGLTWTVDDTLVLEPAPDTWRACVVAHPDVIFDGTTWHLWFKAQQTHTICDFGAPAPSWGCNPVTGVGYATSTDGVNFTVADEPVLNLFSFGFPAVVEVDGVLRMFLAYSNARSGVYEVWESVSIDGGANWSTPQFIIGPGFADWVEDEIYNPSVVCDPTSVEPFGPFVLFAGGRDIEPVLGGPPQIVTAGLGRAYSTDGVSWSWDGTEPLIEWQLRPEPPEVPDRDWRHWDAMRVGDEVLLYFSERDDLGRNRIGLAYTYDVVRTAFPERLISNRICRGPVDTGGGIPGDTDTTTETDAPTTDTDTAAAVDTDLPEKIDEKRCGCDTGAPAAWSLLLLPLALRRRRR